MATNEAPNYWTGETVFKVSSQDQPPVDPQIIIDLGRRGLTMVGADPNKIPVLRLCKSGSVTPAEVPDNSPDL